MSKGTVKYLDAAQVVKRNLEICIDHDMNQLSIPDLADKYQLSERQIYRILGTSGALLEIVGKFS